MIVTIDGDIFAIPGDVIQRSDQNRKAMISDLTWYDQPRSYLMADRLRIRNMVQRVDPTVTEILRRADLTSTPLTMAKGWGSSLQAYIQRMSNIHDPVTYPLAMTVRHILDQFYDPRSGEFAANAQGLSSPNVYQALTRAVNP